MKASFIIHLLWTLASTPMASATNKFWTTKKYSDSSCAYLYEIITSDSMVITLSDCAAYPTTTCTQNVDDPSSYESTSCDSTLTSAMGENAYALVWETGASCTDDPLLVRLFFI